MSFEIKVTTACRTNQSPRRGAYRSLTVPKNLDNDVDIKWKRINEQESDFPRQIRLSRRSSDKHGRNLIDDPIRSYSNKTRVGISQFLPPYIALISAFTAQMALLGFIFPLFITPETCHLMVKDYWSNTLTPKFSNLESKQPLLRRHLPEHKSETLT